MQSRSHPLDLRESLKHNGNNLSINNNFEDKIKDNKQNDKRHHVSKLPRIIKPIQLKDRFNKGSCNSRGQRDYSGAAANKLARSHIPCRRALVKNTSGSVAGKSNLFITGTPNIHRVQVLNISPDFSSKDQIPTTSVASTRPIPKLQEIYRQNDVITDEQRLYDWFIELATPVLSQHTSPDSLQNNISNNTKQSVTNTEISNDSHRNSKNFTDLVSSNNFSETVFKNAEKNVTVWLTDELAKSNKDNDSGYHTISPPSNIRIHKSQYSDDSIAVTFIKNSLNNETENKRYVTEDSEVARDNSFEKPTVIMNKLILAEPPTESSHKSTTNPFMPAYIVEEVITDAVPDRSKNFQFPSIINPSSTNHITNNVPVPSYVVCPSEVLQKTTNFEADGCESPNTINSITGTDLEIRDFSSHHSSVITLEQIDDYTLEDTALDWCTHRCSSQSCLTFIKPTKPANETNKSESWFSRYCNDCIGASEATLVRDTGSSRYNYGPNYYEKNRNQCKIYRFHRRFPSERYNLTRQFETLRRTLAFRRICRRRLNYMWKKSIIRWPIWSRSTFKFKKFRIRRSLPRSIIWEDVDVQTSVLQYEEIGTDMSLVQQKSAAITTSTNDEQCNSKIDSGTTDSSSRSFKTHFKHINLGPSRFPFLYNTKIKSLPLPKIEKAHKPMPKYNSYPSHIKEDEDAKLVESKSNVKATQSKNNIVQLSEIEVLERTSKLTRNHITDLNESVPLTKIERTNKLMKSGNIDNIEHVEVELSMNSDAKTTKLTNKDTVILTTPIMRKSDIVHTTMTDLIKYQINRDRIQDADTQILVNNNKTGCNKIFNNNVMNEITFSNKVMETHCTVSVGTLPQMCKVSLQKVSVQNSINESSANIEGRTEIRNRHSKPKRERFNLTYADTKLVSISSAKLIPVSIATSKENAIGTEVMTSNKTLITKSCETPSCMKPDQFQDYQSRVITFDDFIVSNTDQSLSPFNISKPKTVEQNTETTKTSSLLTQAPSITNSYKPVTFTETGTTTILLMQKSANIVALLNKTTQSDDYVTCEESCNKSMSATISTNIPQKKSIGLSTSNTPTRCSLTKRSKIDAGVQYSCYKQFTDENIRRPNHIGRSWVISSQMLSDQSISETTEQLAPPHCEIDQVVSCGCARVGHDIETNTQSYYLSNLNIKYSTEMMQCKPTPVKDILTTCPSKKSKPSKTENFTSQTHGGHLISLSHMTGTTKSSTDMDGPALSNTVLSSDLNAEKWIRRCTANDDKDYQSLLYNEQSILKTLKHNLLSSNNSTKSKSTKRSLKTDTLKSSKRFIPKPDTSPPLPFALSTDSLADVLPAKVYEKTEDIVTKQTSVMVDKVTSDDKSFRNVKESMLQTCPDIRHAATESRMNYQKSASVLTSRCLLPSPKSCCHIHADNHGSIDCIFIYDHPRCLVHEKRLDSAIQSLSRYDNEKEAAMIRALAVRSAAILTSWCGLDLSMHRSHNHHRKSQALTEVTQTCVNNYHGTLPPQMYDKDSSEDCGTQHLIDSCRYFSNLFAKHFDKVKKNVTKHLALPNDQYLYQISTFPNISYTEACTMKPSGREELACQTHGRRLYRPLSCCALTPSLTSLTGGRDKNQLNSIYHMLTAIEGRIRRLKLNISE